MVTVGSNPGPSLTPLVVRSITRSRNWSWMGRSTRSRVPARQTCPELPQAVASAPMAAAWRSASAKTTLALFPPSSRVTRFRRAAAAAWIVRPVSVDPVRKCPVLEDEKLTAGSALCPTADRSAQHCAVEIAVHPARFISAVGRPGPGSGHFGLYGPPGYGRRPYL